MGETAVDSVTTGGTWRGISTGGGISIGIGLRAARQLRRRARHLGRRGRDHADHERRHVRERTADRCVMEKRDDQRDMEDDRTRNPGIARTPVARGGRVDRRNAVERRSGRQPWHRRFTGAWLAGLPAGWRERREDDGQANDNDSHLRCQATPRLRAPGARAVTWASSPGRCAWWARPIRGNGRKARHPLESPFRRPDPTESPRNESRRRTHRTQVAPAGNRRPARRRGIAALGPVHVHAARRRRGPRPPARALESPRPRPPGGSGRGPPARFARALGRGAGRRFGCGRAVQGDAARVRSRDARAVGVHRTAERAHRGLVPSVGTCPARQRFRRGAADAREDRRTEP